MRPISAAELAVVIWVWTQLWSTDTQSVNPNNGQRRSEPWLILNYTLSPLQKSQESSLVLCHTKLSVPDSRTRRRTEQNRTPIGGSSWDRPTRALRAETKRASSLMEALCVCECVDLITHWKYWWTDWVSSEKNTPNDSNHLKDTSSYANTLKCLNKHNNLHISTVVSNHTRGKYK